MRLFILTILVSVNSVAIAQSIGRVTFSTPVYQRPNEESKVLFYIQPGESISLEADEAHGGYMPIRIIRGGKWRSGFIPEVALAGVRTAGRKVWTESKWGVGGGVNLTYLLQKPRTFDTEDQVRYTTSDFSSMSYGAGLTVQFKETNFWRFTLAYKLTDFKGTALTNVTGDTVKPVSMKHTMVSGLLEKAFTPFKGSGFYLGGGLEVAKAMSIVIILDKTTLPTTSQNLPVYLVGEGFVGNNWRMNPEYALFTEFRAGVIPNQNPPIFQYELAMGLIRLF